MNFILSSLSSASPSLKAGVVTMAVNISRMRYSFKHKFHNPKPLSIRIHTFLHGSQDEDRKAKRRREKQFRKEYRRQIRKRKHPGFKQHIWRDLMIHWRYKLAARKLNKFLRLHSEEYKQKPLQNMAEFIPTETDYMSEYVISKESWNKNRKIHWIRKQNTSESQSRLNIPLPSIQNCIGWAGILFRKSEKVVQKGVEKEIVKKIPPHKQAPYQEENTNYPIYNSTSNTVEKRNSWTPKPKYSTYSECRARRQKAAKQARKMRLGRAEGQSNIAKSQTLSYEVRLAEEKRLAETGPQKYIPVKYSEDAAEANLMSELLTEREEALKAVQKMVGDIPIIRPHYADILFGENEDNCYHIPSDKISSPKLIESLLELDRQVAVKELQRSVARKRAQCNIINEPKSQKPSTHIKESQWKDSYCDREIMFGRDFILGKSTQDYWIKNSISRPNKKKKYSSDDPRSSAAKVSLYLGNTLRFKPSFEENEEEEEWHKKPTGIAITHLPGKILGTITGGLKGLIGKK